MKRLTPGFILILCLIVISYGEVRATSASEPIRETGTLRLERTGINHYVYYMIYAHDGNRCNPLNLPSMYAKDGLQVRFTGNKIDAHDLWFIERMPGPYIELTSIELLGDLNSDMKVNSTDAYMFVLAYGSRPVDAEWNRNADLNYDNFTDISDAILLAGNYGMQVP